jgi:nitrate reductase assembly molybdenum cofactor insertion protein NarJ
MDALAGAGAVAAERAEGQVAVHDALAALLEYPTGDWAADVRGHVARVRRDCPAAAPALAALEAFATGHDLSAAEEQHVRTFDVNAERALEVGWQVFGEQYARGSFLVKLRQLLRSHELPETTELPDHLTQVLRLLGRMESTLATYLAEAAAWPAVLRLGRELPAESPYGGVVAAVAVLLERHAPRPSGDPAGHKGPVATDGPGRRHP